MVILQILSQLLTSFVLLQMKDIQEEFDRLQMETDEAVVPTLSFQHILFDNSPVIPLAILI